MTLQPCAACHRHVDVTSPTCPFCGASVAPSHARGQGPFGRLSRAAIFAGATLATTAACGGGKPKPDQKPQTADAGVPDAPAAQPDLNNTPMPYGAPPARRRIV